MSLAAEDIQVRSYVLVQMGKRKLALPAGSVIELVAPGKEQQIPHRTPWLAGIILRRGRIVPICDVGLLLGEQAAPLNSFRLIAQVQSNSGKDWYAIPVAGECVLVTPEAIVQTDDRAACVAELLKLGDEHIEILDLGKLIQEQESAFAAELNGSLS